MTSDHRTVNDAMSKRRRRYPKNSNSSFFSRPLLVVVICVAVAWWFYYHPRDPTLQLLKETRALNRKKFRIVVPASSKNPIDAANSFDATTTNLEFYSYEQQRAFIKNFGSFCQLSFSKSQENIMLRRFDELPPEYATQLFQHCILYTGVANIYWQADNLQLLVPWSDFIKLRNVAIQIQDNKLSHSLLQVDRAKSRLCQNMMRILVESRQLDPFRYSELLAMYVNNDKQEWTLLEARCTWTGDKHDVQKEAKYVQSHARAALAPHCPTGLNQPCCQVWSEDVDVWTPSMLLQHPYLTTARSGAADASQIPMPFVEIRDPDKLILPVDDLPFIATVHEVQRNVEVSAISNAATPNFFDILVENSCLPEHRDCFKCLKTYKENAEPECFRCQKECPCFCRALCNIRPPPKHVAAEWIVRPPLYRKGNRLIPRIIHQTWFEPVDKEKYPNMSRLIESFQQSGWEYYFYDDATAGQFISTHFPPQVRDAYDAILPGAFKADLFRYCVLLIRGGLYADMDIMLEGNLDLILTDDLGFMTAQDEPGMQAGHRSCLWNGLMASTPGHPFLIRTIENVVNNIRNRFTSVDYDDMLCPNPVLSVSHTTDMLFTCGPCILGASINDILKRHRQTSFDYGDIDLFETEKSKHEGMIVLEADDPRLKIRGRSLLLKQNKDDMGAHRFTDDKNNIVVASTDLPDSDDRPKSLVHYSKTHEKIGIYGLNNVYADNIRANEWIQIRIANDS
jgi:hypothetical protein